MEEALDPVRLLVKTRIRDLGLNFANVSKAIGRNRAYIQQFIRRGIPDVLAEGEREALASILHVPVDQLRGATPGKGGPKLLAPDGVAASPDELELLRVYRILPVEQRGKAIAIVKALR